MVNKIKTAITVPYVIAVFVLLWDLESRNDNNNIKSI